MIGIGALCLFTAAGCASTGPKPPGPQTTGDDRGTTTGTLELLGGKSPLQKLDGRLADEKGRLMILKRDATGNVSVQVEDPTEPNPERKARLYEYDVQSADKAQLQVCNASKTNCQPMTYLSEGSVTKLGTNTCTCCVINGRARCIGGPGECP
jgi:hypothetical protein